MSAVPKKGQQHEVIDVGATNLTDRQHLVLTMYAAGYTRTMVARALGLSSKTIERHLGHAVMRLRAKTIHQAVAMVAVSNVFAAAAQSETSDTPEFKGRGRPSNRGAFYSNAPRSCPKAASFDDYNIGDLQ